MRSLGENMSIDRVKEMIRGSDKDGDGEVDLDGMFI
jgi:Ca2+-binding EF-hand superfamily protein